MSGGVRAAGPPEGRERTLAGAEQTAWWGLVVLTVLLSAWAHRCAGLTLPLPWGDEAWLVWKSRSLLETGSLFTPELNPDRMIVNFPVYEVIQAAVLWCVGPDLERLRWSSWAFSMAAYGFTLAWLRRLPLRLLTTSVLSAFFLSAPVVAAGNILRPDSLMLSYATVCLWLYSSGRRWLMLAVLGLALVTHPMGPFIALVFGPLWLLDVIRRPGWPDRVGGVALALATLVGMGVAAYVVVHWADVVRDYTLIAGDHMSESPWRNLWRHARHLWMLGLLLAAVAAVRWERRLLPALGLALTLQLLQVMRLEMWYALHQQYSAAVLFLALPVLVQAGLRGRPGGRRWATGVALVVGAGLMLFALRTGMVEGPRGFPRDLAWGWGMRATGEVRYAEERDLEAVAAALRAHVSDPQAPVIFRPEGEAFLFSDRLRGRVRVMVPIDAQIQPQWLVQRDSRYIPDWVARGGRAYVARAGRDPVVLHEREGTERWTLWRVAPPASAPAGQ